MLTQQISPDNDSKDYWQKPLLPKTYVVTKMKHYKESNNLSLMTAGDTLPVRVCCYKGATKILRIS